MARIARVVAPDMPHHITQRGNRNQPVFFSEEDRKEYLRLVHKHSRLNDVQIWAYCLMDNHVHFIAVPPNKDGLTKCFQEAHRLYTRRINFREGWRGYLWQGRFASFPMDERYLVAAMRYVEVNPVRAGLVERAEEYPWSSAKARVYKKDDPVLSHCFLEDEIRDWSEFLKAKLGSESVEIERSMRTGRPLGSLDFIKRLESILSRPLGRRKPGPKPASNRN